MSQEGAALLWWILGLFSLALGSLSIWAWTHTHRRINGKADAQIVASLLETATEDKRAREVLAQRVEDRTVSRAEFEGHEKLDDERHGAINSEVRSLRQRTHDLGNRIAEIFTRQRWNQEDKDK